MSGVIRYCMVGLIALSLQICAGSCVENITLNINCTGQPTWRNTEITGQFQELQGSSTLDVHCFNVRRDISFIIFQVHAYRYNVILYQDVIKTHTSFNGTNVGMHSKNEVDKTHSFSIANLNDVAVKMYISIHAYNESAPIPGGCTLVTVANIAPTLNINYTTDSVLSVSIQPARIGDAYKCGEQNMKGLNFQLTLNHRFYRLYMPERDYSEKEYFDSIKKMLILENIVQYAEELPDNLLRNMDTIKMFSAYPGTGSVYVAVAITMSGSAVYVPSHTYGCASLDEDFQCAVFSDVFTQVVCAILIFLGLFVCYFGHRFIKTEMFLMGMMAGAIITYIVISQHTHLDSTAQTGAALLSGVFGGAMWWLVWWFYGMPVISVLLPTSLLGLLFANFVVFCLPDAIQPLALEVTYWPIIVILTLLVPTVLVFYTQYANYLSCAIIGGFLTIFPIDFYVGTNLRYVIVNMVRRAGDPQFAYAFTGAPYQMNDGVVMGAWIALSISGFLLQKWHNSGRAPFPPPPRDALPRPALRPRYRVGSRASEARASRRYTDASRRYTDASRRYIDASEASPLLA